MAKLKFKGHGTFFIRKGWLSKGLRAIKEDDQVFNPSNILEAMDCLGLGKNQVASLRYWLKTVNLITEKGSGQNKYAELTPFGKIVSKRDPYMEEIGTLWAIHCMLACSKEEATSWYWLFNRYGASSITKEDFIEGVRQYALDFSVEGSEKARSGSARSSIESDYACILQTYIPHTNLSGKTSPESVINCPLSELGIIEMDSDASGKCRKRQANTEALPSIMVLFAIINALALEEGMTSRSEKPVIEITLNKVLNGEFFPGRLFNLDSVLLLSKLYELENDGYLRVNRTAGTDVLRLEDMGLSQWDCLNKYYDLIG